MKTKNRFMTAAKKTGKKTKLFKAYTDGKPSFKKQGISGVYFIFNRDKKLKYIGFSASCVYKALYRHFQSWNDKTQERFTYPRDYYVRLIITSPTRAQDLEKYLILKMSPPDGLIKYNKYSPEKENKMKHIIENLETGKEVDEEIIPF